MGSAGNVGPSSNRLSCVDPAGTNDLRATVHTDYGAQLSDSERRPRKCWSDEIKEVVNVGCHAVHYCDVFDLPGGQHLCVEHFQGPLAGKGLSSLLNPAPAEVD